MVSGSIRALLGAGVSLTFEERTQEREKRRVCALTSPWWHLRLPTLERGTHFVLALAFGKLPIMHLKQRETNQQTNNIPRVVTIVYFERALNFSSP